jgi:glycerate kinase
MKRKVVVCPDSFKGSISSYDACVAMEKGLFDCEVIKIPIADGGEGTLDAVAKDVVTQNVTGPDGQKIFARYGVSGGTAVVEMAEAAGLIKTVKKCA